MMSSTAADDVEQLHVPIHALRILAPPLGEGLYRAKRLRVVQVKALPVAG
jgi:hypothetical protein